MDNEVTKLLVERYYENESPSEWAIKCLESGFDSKSLRILASMVASHANYELDDYFQRSLKELGWDKIEAKDYLLRYAEMLAEEILADKIDPFKGSKEIYLILVDLFYPPESRGWIYINEMIGDYQDFLRAAGKVDFYTSKEEIISDIKKASKELLKST